MVVLPCDVVCCSMMQCAAVGLCSELSKVTMVSCCSVTHCNTPTMSSWVNNGSMLQCDAVCSAALCNVSSNQLFLVNSTQDHCG